MKCIIIEDQPPAQRILKKYLEDYGLIHLEAVFADAIQALEYLQDHKVDLIFLDIHLPKISGMEFLKALKQRPAVILTTAFPDFALESYDYDVVDYLLKPFSFARFVKAISKVGNSVEASAGPGEESLFIKSGHEYIKVRLAHIFFIKADADYTELYLADKKVLTSDTLKYWEEKLEAQGFIRVHKSYLVNIKKIVKVRANQIFFQGQPAVPVGRSYKEEFEKRVLN